MKNDGSGTLEVGRLPRKEATILVGDVDQNSA